MKTLLTPTEEKRIIVGSLTSRIAQLKAFLLSSQRDMMELFWKPQHTTTQEIADALGVDVQELYQLGGALERFLDLFEPENKVALMAFISQPRSEHKAPTAQPLANTEWNEDGTATIVPFPEPEPESEE